MRAETLVLVGAFHEALEAAEAAGRRVLGVIDNDLQGELWSIPLLGTDKDREQIAEQYPEADLLLTPDSPALRRRLAELYSGLTFRFPTIVHPGASISSSATLAEGVFVQDFCVISSEVALGRFCRINIRATVMHDTKVGDFSTIAPGATVLGRVTIGEGCYIGSNATILPNLTIGSDVIVGAGAVVTRDVANGQTVMGVPAR